MTHKSAVMLLQSLVLAAAGGVVHAGTESSCAVLGAAGGTASSMSFETEFTLGEPMVGESVSPSFGIAAGFWYGVGFCIDFDLDGFGEPDGDTCPPDNCPRLWNPDQDDADEDGLGNVCDPDGDDDGILEDGDGSGVVGDHPCTGGQIADCDDNCRLIPNANQTDGNANGRGTACETECDLLIGPPQPAPGPQPDFATIAQALAAVTPGGERVVEDGCTLRVLPATYVEPLVVDRFVRMKGVDGEASTFIAVEGAVTAIEIPDREIPGQVRIQGFTISNASSFGIDAMESLVLVESDVRVSGVGVRLGIGSHRIEDVTVEAGGGGIELGPFADASIERCRITGTGAAAAGLVAAGRAELANSVITCNLGTGISLEATGSLRMSFATLAGNGVGFETSSSDVEIDHSIICGNATDVVGASCSWFAFSDICGMSCAGLGALDCMGSEGNVDADPQFVDAGCPGDYHLRLASPAVEAGVAPQCVTGVPCKDFDGHPRVLDGDGDLQARADLGAYEVLPPLVPGEIEGLRLLRLPLAAHLTWAAEPNSDRYNIYRGLLRGLQVELGYDHWGDCVATNFGASNTEFIDAVNPPAGEGFFYVIAGENDTREGTKGFAACAERSNYAPCP